MMIENGEFVLGVTVKGRDVSSWAKEESNSSNLSEKYKTAMLNICFFAEKHYADGIKINRATAVVSKGLVNFKVDTQEMIDGLSAKYLPSECIAFSGYLVKRRDDQLIAYDMKLSKYPERVVSEDADVADLFEAIKTLKGLPREVFIDE